jgi:diguanylate cyclase (GGDEF)-like protein/PAS domain S-box-containing protein
MSFVQHLRRTARSARAACLTLQERISAMRNAGALPVSLGSQPLAEAQALAQLQHLTCLYRALSEVNQAIVRMEREADLFPRVSRIAVECGGMALAWIGQPQPGSDRIAPVACHGQHRDYLDGIVVSLRADVPEGCGPVGIAFRENRNVILTDYVHSQATAPWHARAAAYGWKAIGAFPIVRGGQPYAVLCVYHVQSSAFEPAAVGLLDQMTRDIGFALDNFDVCRRRSEAEAALLHSEQRFRAYFERSMVGMATISLEKGWLEVNDALCRLLGYRRDELMQMSWEQLTHADDLAADAAQFRRVQAGELDEYALDKRFIRKDGGIVYAHAAARAVRRSDGGLDYFVLLVEDITEMKKAEAAVWQQANYDSLTALPNRRLFYDRLAQEMKKVRRAEEKLALLFIDLDHFKEVNDMLGHDAGDLLLADAAHRISACVRDSDTVARLGGDEFAVVLPNLIDVSPAEQVARAIVQSLVLPFGLGGESAYVSASIGITFYPDDADSIETLLKHADQAMYVAKNSGRNRFSYFTANMQAAAQERQLLLRDLRGALAAGQFEVYYQPMVALGSGAIVKAEALLRWHHPQRGMIEPARFIPLAEENGLIGEIGDWVFRQAACMARRCADLQLPAGSAAAPLQISVNKSPRQFVAGNTHGTWLEHLRQIGLATTSMVVEITEGLLLDERPEVRDRLARFRASGIAISLDDFGTGYSAMSYLKKFEIDFLKIDQSFVRDMANDAGDQAIAEAIIVMAHKLGIAVIAEGIETCQQRELLLAAGCDFGQGYLFARPMPADALLTLLASGNGRLRHQLQ